MKDKDYEIVASNFSNTAEIPKDEDIFYRCNECNTVIPSVPDDNIGCECGNIFIDKDAWRLVVVNLKTIDAVKKKG